MSSSSTPPLCDYFYYYNEFHRQTLKPLYHFCLYIKSKWKLLKGLTYITWANISAIFLVNHCNHFACQTFKSLYNKHCNIVPFSLHYMLVDEEYIQMLFDVHICTGCFSLLVEHYLILRIIWTKYLCAFSYSCLFLRDIF